MMIKFYLKSRYISHSWRSTQYCAYSFDHKIPGLANEIWFFEQKENKKRELFLSSCLGRNKTIERNKNFSDSKKQM